MATRAALLVAVGGGGSRRGFVQTRPEVLSTIKEPWQLAVLPIHDAANCAVNLINLPFVSYAGSLDLQREQHLIVPA